MRTTTLFLCGLSLAVITATARAQGEAQRGAVDVAIGGDSAQQSGPVIRASDLLRLNVYNKSDERLGEIEDLVIDPKNGTIRYAVLSFGGILGVGDKLFAVPWEKLALVSKGTSAAGTMKEDYCLLDIPKEVLRQAPGFDKRNWPNFATRDWSGQVDRYYQAQRESAGPDSRR